MRLAALGCLAGALGIGLFDASGASAGSGDDESTPDGGIDVVQVEGLLDPANASLIHSAIDRANERGSTLLVLQIDSGGAVDVDVDSLVDDVLASQVPIAAWVGPSGSNGRGAIGLLVEAAHIASVSQGSGIGPVAPLRLDQPGDPSTEEVADELASLAEDNSRSGDGARRLATDRLSADEAHDTGAVNLVAPTIGELVVQLDGRVVTTVDGPQVLSTATVVGEGVDRRRQPNQEVRFDRLNIDAQILHTLTSPSIAYLLFVVGLALMVFEFYTVSIGIAGVIGALCLIASAIGFSHLPVEWWALGLLLLSIFGFAVDVQAGRPAVWTGIGTVALVVGSITLFGGSSRLDLPWWVILIVVVATVLFMIGAMPAVIRSRFSTPTVGREGMLGRMGTAEVEVAPEGVVVIGGARWRARANRATPLAAGDPCRVVAVDGLVLEVEPESGGAQDYRERARGRGRRKEGGE